MPWARVPVMVQLLFDVHHVPGRLLVLPVVTFSELLQVTKFGNPRPGIVWKAERRRKMRDSSVFSCLAQPCCTQTRQPSPVATFWLPFTFVRALGRFTSKYTQPGPTKENLKLPVIYRLCKVELLPLLVCACSDQHCSYYEAQLDV